MCSTNGTALLELVHLRVLHFENRQSITSRWRLRIYPRRSRIYPILEVFKGETYGFENITYSTRPHIRLDLCVGGLKISQNSRCFQQTVHFTKQKMHIKNLRVSSSKELIKVFGSIRCVIWVIIGSWRFRKTILCEATTQKLHKEIDDGGGLGGGTTETIAFVIFTNSNVMFCCECLRIRRHLRYMLRYSTLGISIGVRLNGHLNLPCQLGVICESTGT